MKNIILIIILTILGYAIPAYNGDMEFKQKDGFTFFGNLKGDEYFSWVEDEQGNVIKYNNNSKNYEYAKLEDANGTIELVPSGLAVSDVSSSSRSSSAELIDKKTLSKIWQKKREKSLKHMK